jgi:hypothetical protein
MGPVVLAAAPLRSALGDMIHDVEDFAPAVFPANLPDPQLQLVNMIALLFAGSLSILIFGYIFESTNFAGPASRTDDAGPDQR